MLHGNRCVPPHPPTMGLTQRLFGGDARDWWPPDGEYQGLVITLHALCVTSHNEGLIACHSCPAATTPQTTTSTRPMRGAGRWAGHVPREAATCHGCKKAGTCLLSLCKQYMRSETHLKEKVECKSDQCTMVRKGKSKCLGGKKCRRWNTSEAKYRAGCGGDACRQL